MTNRVPSSTRPPARSEQAPAPKRAPSAEPEKPKAKAKVETASPEAAAWSGRDRDHSLAEVSLKEVEGVVQQQAAEDAHADEAKERGEETTRQPEPDEHGWKSKAAAPPAQPKPARKKDGFEVKTQRQALSSASHGDLPAAVGKAQNALTGSSARADRPPDAFALLREAREQGVLFVEDSLQEGHSEEQDDPELASAVEECIRRCFGVRGILRIGPGRDDHAQPLIVVVASQGFTEASLAHVPPRVHRFDTLIAIPFELLPLRRER